MCQLFIGAAPELWGSRTKSLRIDGVATSIRMEEFFWQVLEEIAARDAMTANQLITRLYFEAIDAGHDMGNFTSFLRVCCARFLALAADGEIRRSEDSPLSQVDAPRMLQREAGRAAERSFARRDAAGKRLN